MARKKREMNQDREIDRHRHERGGGRAGGRGKSEGSEEETQRPLYLTCINASAGASSRSLRVGTTNQRLAFSSGTTGTTLYLFDATGSQQ